MLLVAAAAAAPPGSKPPRRQCHIHLRRSTLYLDDGRQNRRFGGFCFGVGEYIHCVMDGLWNKHVFFYSSNFNLQIDDLIFHLY